MEWTVWLAFFVASWAISLSPGPGAVAAMSAGLNHGFRKGYWITAGLIAGIWIQVLLVGVGLGAILAASNARSARCNSTSGVCASTGHIAYPMLASAETATPASSASWPSVSCRRRRMPSTESAVTPGSTMPNSSPPRRATVSPCRTAAVSR